MRWREAPVCCSGKNQREAIVPLAQALKERQRQLTPFASEIYAAAILYGQALAAEKKYDTAAVAFLVATSATPSLLMPRKLRAEALVKAGKPDVRNRSQPGFAASLRNHLT